MDFKCAKISDFDRIADFYRSVIENTSDIEKYARWVYGQHPTDVMILNYIRQGAMYLLMDAQTIVGAVALTPSQGEDYHTINWAVDAADDEVTVVHLLCVHPAYQRQGIGKRLILESIGIAENALKKAIRLDALASNTPAHRMYRSLGFEHRGTQHLYAENTGWTDFLFFEYVLKKV